MNLFPGEGLRRGWLWSGVCPGAPISAGTDAGDTALPPGGVAALGAPQMRLLHVEAVVKRPGLSPQLYSHLVTGPWAARSPPWASVSPEDTVGSYMPCSCSDGQLKR